MSHKKIRGIKRKTNNMVRSIEELTEEFPSDFYRGFWHIHLPVAKSFIDSEKTPKSIRHLCIQTLVERTQHLISIKPDLPDVTRVVAAIELPNLWDSQIIVFYGNQHFDGFFDRNDESQKWTPLSETRNIADEWGLSIPHEMSIMGVKEVLTDEDYVHEGEIWFIGELR
ncbi:DUF3916 domain-containing protein [Alicyclobacillus tolerans]|uniref:DUF3916 domain-containing protein n=1 Tax=Alicyclobacillus tolerans TaxID=90970 RepID=UPI001F37105E|nr:DUF3916 domain-containing protein [Alicyclobacillus tolerans]MCF8566231.1 DUF3916 domain-containing protein [Alicyclobacillus tolerans]